MSLTKKVCIVAVCAAIILVYGCGSKETQQGAESKAAVEQQAQETAAESGTQELKPQTVCPVMGGQIDKSMYVEKDGKRIYMCCEHCREGLTKNFEENVKKLAKMGQKPETL